MENEYQELDLELAEDEQLTDAKEELIAKLTEGQGTRLDSVLNTLLEIERELTLREDR